MRVGSEMPKADCIECNTDCALCKYLCHIAITFSSVLMTDTRRSIAIRAACPASLTHCERIDCSRHAQASNDWFAGSANPIESAPGFVRRRPWRVRAR